MKHKTSITDETKAINYEPMLYPVFKGDSDDNEEMEEEPDGYQCMKCGAIQKDCNSYTCRRCYGSLIEWYF